MAPRLRPLLLLLSASVLAGFDGCELPFFRFATPEPAQLSLPGALDVALELPASGTLDDLEARLDGAPLTPGLVATADLAEATIDPIAQGPHILVASARWEPPFPINVLIPRLTLTATRRFRVVNLDRPDSCEILNDVECLLPYPSSRFLEPAPTPTGWRVAFPDDALPAILGEGLSPEPFAELDGFGPGTQPLFFFPDVDLAGSGAPGLDPLTRTFDARSLEPDSPTVLIDAATGERLLHFVELDARIDVSDDPTRQAIILRPGVTLRPGGRYIVAVRGLQHGDGSPVEAAPVFAALRDGAPSTIPALEARRARHEEIFGILAGAGVDRDALILAFDFVVQSQEHLTGKLLAMRDRTYAWLDAQVAAGNELFSVDEAASEELDCGAGGLWRDVQGTFRVPLFLDRNPLTENMELGRLVLDGEGLPSFAREGPGGTYDEIVDARFTVLVPCSVDDPGRTVRPLLHAHGGGSDYRDPRLHHDTWNGARSAPGLPAADRNLPLVAPHLLIGGTDNHGFGRLEFAGLGASFLYKLFFEADGAPALTGRILQGQMNLLVLGRLMKHALFNSDPWFQTGEGRGVFPGPGDEMYMWGVSFGGYSAFIHGAVSPDVAKVLPAVAVVNFANQSQRDEVFDALDFLLPIVLGPDSMTHLLVTSISHDLWAQVDPVAYLRHLRADPLDGVTTKPVLHVAGWLDQKSPNIFSDVASRDLALESLAGSFRTGLVGIPDLPGPLESAYVSYWTALDVDDPAHFDYLPPLANRTAPRATPSCDPHILTWMTPAFHEQAGLFFRPGGLVENTCSGPCDGAEAHEREFGNAQRCDPTQD